MKHVVTGKQNGRPVLNMKFLHFAHHYGFSPKLCLPYSPWVKGKVERPMDYIRERFWRGYTYASLARTNDDVKLWLESANKRIHGTHHQVVGERWEKERDYLGSLPLADYGICKIENDPLGRNPRHRSSSCKAREAILSCLLQGY